MVGSVNKKPYGLSKLGKDTHVGSPPCSELCVLARCVSIHYLRHSTLIHVSGCRSILLDWTKKGNWADIRQPATHPSEAFGTLACLALPRLWVFKSESKVIGLAEYSKRLCLSIPVITSAGVYHNVCVSCFNTETFSMCFSPFIVLQSPSESFERSAKAQRFKTKYLKDNFTQSFGSVWCQILACAKQGCVPPRFKIKNAQFGLLVLAA